MEVSQSGTDRSHDGHGVVRCKGDGAERDERGRVQVRDLGPDERGGPRQRGHRARAGIRR